MCLTFFPIWSVTRRAEVYNSIFQCHSSSTNLSFCSPSSCPPSPVPLPIFHSHLSLTLPVDPMWAWPVSCCGCSRRTTWCVAVQNGTKGSAVEKGLCAASADRLTRPLPASDPLLTGNSVCQGRKKCKQRGSVHPGAEHRTLFILSPKAPPCFSSTNLRLAIF